MTAPLPAPQPERDWLDWFDWRCLGIWGSLAGGLLAIGFVAFVTGG